MGDSVLPPHHPACHNVGKDSGRYGATRHPLGVNIPPAVQAATQVCIVVGHQIQARYANHSGGIVHGVIGDSGLLGACLPQSGDTDLPWRVPGPLMDHGGVPSLASSERHQLLTHLFPAGRRRCFRSFRGGPARDAAPAFAVLPPSRASSFVITSNRAVEEWLSLFDDPILGNSALDRLANCSYQIIIEGKGYRERLSPHRALLGRVAKILGKGGD